MEESPKNKKDFWFKIGVIILAAAVIAGGFLYWKFFWPGAPGVKPEKLPLPAVSFHPIKLAFSRDEKTVFIAAIEGMEIFDNVSGKLYLAEMNKSLSPFSNIAVNSDSSRVYTVDRELNKVYVYGDKKFVKELSTGAGPGQIFFNNKTSRLFVFNIEGRTVTVIDTENYKVLKTIDIGSNALGGALDEKSNKFYLVGENGKLAVIDGESLKIIKTIDVGLSPDGYQTPFDEETERMYFVNKGGSDNRLWIIDTASASVADSIAVPKGTEVMTLGSLKKKLYIASPNEHAVLVFDTKTNELQKIELSPTSHPYMAQADEKNGRLYVYDTGRTYAVIVADMTGKTLKSIPVGFFGRYTLTDFRFSAKTETLYALSQKGGFMMTLKGDGEPQFFGKKPEVAENKINRPAYIRVGSFSGRFYAINNFSDNYLTYDSKSLELSGEVSLGGGPYSILFSSSGLGKTYIINRGINEVWLIDSKEPEGNLSVGKKIPIGHNIFSGTDIDEFNKMYITTENSVVVLDSQKDEVIKTIPVGKNPKILGRDENQKKLFIAVDDALLVIDGQTDTVKKSFEFKGINKSVITADKTNEEIYKIYVLKDGRNLTVFDAKNDKFVKNLILDKPYEKMAFAPWLKKLYLMNSDGAELAVLDGNTLKETSTIDIRNKETPPPPQPPYPQYDIARVTDIYPQEKANKIFLMNHRDGWIEAVDTNSNEVIKTIAMPYSSRPKTLAVDDKLGRLYVANELGNSIYVFDLSSYELKAVIGPDGKTTWLTEKKENK